jgi:hypothetical protein
MKKPGENEGFLGKLLILVGSHNTWLICRSRGFYGGAGWNNEDVLTEIRQLF